MTIHLDELHYPQGHVWRQNRELVSHVLKVRQQMGLDTEYRVSEPKRLRIVGRAA